MQNVRLQETVDDLFVEYNAWVNNVLDEHDVAVRALKATWNPEFFRKVVPWFARFAPDVPLAASHGKCDCYEGHLKNQVIAHLQLRLAEARGRRSEWDRQVRCFERRLIELGGTI